MNELPKLYRRCWVKLYWLTDTCEGGEHVQRDGYFYLKAMRALRKDKNWFWQIDPVDAEKCRYELSMGDDLPPEEQFEDYIYKDPFPFNERDNYGPVTNRPTIKEKQAVNYEINFNKWPF